MSDLNVSPDVLQAKLDELLDRLDDTEMLRDSVLGQSGQHVPGGYVKRFADEIEELNAEIEAVRASLGKVNPEA
jgi:hypothetical protein